MKTSAKHVCELFGEKTNIFEFYQNIRANNKLKVTDASCCHGCNKIKLSQLVDVVK